MILGIDTTTKICEVSLKLDDGKLFINRIDEGFVHSDRLVPLISDVLMTYKLTVHDISEIFVNIGPGSFTGIRVGVSCARALAQTLDIKIKPIIAMELIKFEAMRIENSFDKLIVLIDALRGEAFAEIYDKDGLKIEDYKIYNSHDIFTLLDTEVKNIKNIVVAGNGCKNFYDIFEKFDNIQILQSENINNFKLSLIETVIFENIEPKNYGDVKPFYLRKTSAEEKQIALATYSEK
jgi:tRNA threonylcarbamoyladenosine biosynthesis protein TsaB